MTNEQAKKMLKAKSECLKRETSGTDFDCNNSNCDECPLCYEQGNMGEQKEALDMAIKALERQPCEDTISRQAAIEALVAETIYTEEELKKYYEANPHRNEWVNGIHEAVEVIKQLPPAQPEQRWIPFKTRPLTEEEKEEHPEWDCILDCKLPGSLK